LSFGVSSLVGQVLVFPEGPCCSKIRYMFLSVGIIGLPNAGKSTLFNALLGRAIADVANYPFCTIEPNTGVVVVPDERLEKLTDLVSPDKSVPSVVKFVDVAGLVKGAAQGSGLGNKFLSHLRECDALCFVLRDFDAGIDRAGSVDPLTDFKVLRLELALKDLETIGKAKTKVKKEGQDGRDKLVFLEKLEKSLGKGESIGRKFDKEEKETLSSLFLLSTKPFFVVVNAAEGVDLKKRRKDLSSLSPIFVSAKLETELGELEDKEQQSYLKELGYDSLGLNRVIDKAFSVLDLIRFYTVKGGKELRSWPIGKGAAVTEAAELVHSDFAEKFIKAEVIGFDSFVQYGSWREAALRGKILAEGKDYVVKDGDIIEFRI